eukprot:TRINITY_DN101611_c0_g1_i1.p1 TRINITY_DN101611_c0_g1~~TRINITY_DN101611_c0_g1_i1.p1  ORF type:complete len:440 (-),score=105.85 TRINITY_DN101611_c0_g1_i1:460-1779(-)
MAEQGDCTLAGPRMALLSKELRDEITSVIDARVAEKEEILWRRGQVEIQRLQKEQLHIKETVNKVLRNQQKIDTEMKKYKGALLNLTKNFETVANEMKHVCKSLPKTTSTSGTALHADSSFHHLSPTPSTASTALPDASRHRRDLPTPMSTMTYADAIAAASADRGTEQRAMGRSTDRSQRWQLRTPAQRPPSTLEVWADEEDTESSTAPLALFQSPQADLSALSLPGLPLTCTPGLPADVMDCSMDGAFNASEILSPEPEGDTPDSSSSNEQVSESDRSGLVCIEIVKEPGFVTLGIEVNENDNPGCLTIEGIDESCLVACHNSRQDVEQHKMRVGDCIVAVNDAKQDPERMLQECKKQQRLQFWILRKCDTRAVQRELSPAGMAAGSLRPEAVPFVPYTEHQVPLPPGLNASAAVAASQTTPSSEATRGEVKRTLFR